MQNEQLLFVKNAEEVSFSCTKKEGAFFFLLKNLSSSGEYKSSQKFFSLQKGTETLKISYILSEVKF